MSILSSGAISKIAGGESVLKPVLQLTHIYNSRGDKQLVHLSDGSVAKVGCISKQMFISKKLEKGSVVQLTKFQYIKLLQDQPLFRGFLCLDLTVIHAKFDIIGHPKLISLHDEPTQDRANVEQPPPTSKQNPSTSTQQNCSSHSPTQNRNRKLHAISLFGTDISQMTKDHKTMAAPTAAVNLTSGAISKISSGSFTDKPVLQVTVIDARQHFTIDKKKCFLVRFSDGTFAHNGSIAVEAVVSNELQKGSVVQLTKFQLAKPFATCKGHILSNRRLLLCLDLTVIRTKCDIIGYPKLILLDDEPTEDRANSHHAEKEPPTSKQNPSTSPTQNKKRKLQSGTAADVSHVMKLTLDETLIDGLGACCEHLLTLEEAVSKMTSLMMEKNKLVAPNFEENLSQMARSMIDIKNKQDDVGACFKKLETLEEDVSKLTRMMMEKSKEDDMGACIEKLDKMGWAAQDPMYDTALLLFGQTADYRKLWLHLKPESCGNWVKNAGSMFGLMD